MKNLRVFIFTVISWSLASGFLYAQNALDRTKPQLIGRPDLPELSLALKKSVVQGILLFRARVDQDGRISEIETIKSSGLEVLDNFCREWIMKWEYLPRLENGEPASGFTVITIRFDMSKAEINAPLPAGPAGMSSSETTGQVPTAESGERPQRKAPVPLEDLSIGEIPKDIQDLFIEGKLTLILTILRDNSVKAIRIREDFAYDSMKKWLKEYLEKTRWQVEFIGDEESVQIVLPLRYNTPLQIIEFGEPAYMNNPESGSGS